MAYLKSLDPNRLVITRGNSAIIDITPIDEDTGLPIKLNEGDKVLFTVKSTLGRTMLQKTLTNEDYDGAEDTSLNCVINPEDTIEWFNDDYIYDCLMIKADGTTITFISSTFTLKDAAGVYTDAR